MPGYDYATQRPSVFTEDGQIMFLQIRDNAARLIAKAGAARLLEIIGGVSGNTWDMLACVDRLVELGELREVTTGSVAGQHRVFINPRNP
jgi:hypothetical protein